MHGPGGTLVGVDQFGNKYFENREKQSGALPGLVMVTKGH